MSKQKEKNDVGAVQDVGYQCGRTSMSDVRRKQQKQMFHHFDSSSKAKQQRMKRY